MGLAVGRGTGEGGRLCRQASVPPPEWAGECRRAWGTDWRADKRQAWDRLVDETVELCQVVEFRVAIQEEGCVVFVGCLLPMEGLTGLKGIGKGRLNVGMPGVPSWPSETSNTQGLVGSKTQGPKRGGNTWTLQETESYWGDGWRERTSP